MPDFHKSPTNNGPDATPSTTVSRLQPKKLSASVRDACTISDLRRQTEYGDRLSRLSKLPYYLRPLPPQLQAEWERYRG